MRGFRNGNAHVWFKRDDLVDRVNQLIGEYYGAPIPEDREPDADTGLHEPKTGLAKSHGWDGIRVFRGGLAEWSERSYLDPKFKVEPLGPLKRCK